MADALQQGRWRIAALRVLLLRKTGGGGAAERRRGLVQGGVPRLLQLPATSGSCCKGGQRAARGREVASLGHSAPAHRLWRPSCRLSHVFVSFSRSCGPLIAKQEDACNILALRCVVAAPAAWAASPVVKNLRHSLQSC